MTAEYSVAMTAAVDRDLLAHLLQHFHREELQEDLCFALWMPSEGSHRQCFLIKEVVHPIDGDRELHGNASFSSQYVERVMQLALAANCGVAFLHSHPGHGWQNMSHDDVVAEERLAPRIFGSTGLPLIGLTSGSDGTWSARVWPRVSRGCYERRWCASVRSVGEELRVSFCDKLLPPPQFKEELKRTYSAWGAQKQALISRLKVGIVGLGSVGSLVAEALARMGVQHLLLLDYDRVEKHNLDRIVHATISDLGQPKVEVVAAQLRRHATAENFDVEPICLSVTSNEGFKAALDCDVLFSCVDRPWPRRVLNHIAYAHLIPVVDGGVAVHLNRSGQMRGADWRAHVAGPEHRCLECLRQFDSADVSLEQSGLLDDPSYTEALPRDHFVHRNENVFGFAMNAAGLQVLQFLMMTIGPSGMTYVGAQTYHMSLGRIDVDTAMACNAGCLYPSILARGDRVGFSVTR